MKKADSRNAVFLMAFCLMLITALIFVFGYISFSRSTIVYNEINFDQELILACRYGCEVSTSIYEKVQYATYRTAQCSAWCEKTYNYEREA